VFTVGRSGAGHTRAAWDDAALEVEVGGRGQQQSKWSRSSPSAPPLSLCSGSWPRHRIAGRRPSDAVEDAPAGFGSHLDRQCLRRQNERHSKLVALDVQRENAHQGWTKVVRAHKTPRPVAWRFGATRGSVPSGSANFPHGRLEFTAVQFLVSVAVRPPSLCSARQRPRLWGIPASDRRRNQNASERAALMPRGLTRLTRRRAPG
jgi:hypothetical protein